MAGVLTINLVYQRAKTDEVDRIKVLNVCGSSLQDIDVLRQLRNLEILSLSVNDIEDIQPLKDLSNLRELYLRQNSISDVQQILHLRGLKRLKTLNLTQNPICRDPNYRRFVISSLPSLAELDDAVVTPEERRAAGQTFSEAPYSVNEYSGLDSDNDVYENSGPVGDENMPRSRGHGGQKVQETSHRRVYTSEGGKPSQGTSSGRPLPRDTGSSIPPSYHQDPGTRSQQPAYQSQLRRSSSDPPRYIPKAAGRGRGVGGGGSSSGIPPTGSPHETGPSEAGVVQAIKVLCSELSPTGVRDVLRFVQSLDSY